MLLASRRQRRISTSSQHLHHISPTSHANMPSPALLVGISGPSLYHGTYGTFFLVQSFFTRTTFTYPMVTFHSAPMAWLTGTVSNHWI